MSKPVVLLADGDLVALPGSADGDVLKWDATTSEWYASAGGGTGTVTSVTLDAGTTGLTISSAASQQITTAGMFLLGGVLVAANGGTGLAAPAALDVGKVLTAKADGTYELAAIPASGVTSLAGTANQVSVSSSTGAVTLSLPQNIATTSSPTFAGVTLSGLSNGLVRSTSGVLAGGATVALGSEVSGTLPIANGGTGLTSAGAPANLLVSDGAALASVAMSGDATITALGAVTVGKIQGRAVSSSAPIAGQSLVWSSAGGGAWVPGDTASGGSGGGGVVYFMNAGTSRTGGGLPAGSYQLGRTAETSSNPITYTNVPTSAWTRVAGFVTDAGDPNLGTLPAGIWDFNVYATSTANSNDMLFRLSFYEYDGSTDPELGSPIATTLSTAIYDPSVPVQYQATFNIPQTAFTGKRIYLKLEAFTSASSKNVTFDFGNSFASHVHTTVPSVTGSGFVKVLNDVFVSTGQLVNLADASDVGASILGVVNGGTGAATTSQRYAFIGPSSGSGAPGFRPLVAADISDLSSAGVTSITGTANQVIASSSTGAVTLSLPQSIGTTSSPTFAGLTLSGLTGYLKGNGGSALSASATIPASDVSGLAGTYAPLASPSFTGTPTAPTAAAGTNTTQVATTAFVTSAVAAAVGVPYDLPVEVPGTPATSTRIVNFKAVRPFRLASSGHQGGCAVTDPSSNTSFTVKKNGSSTGVGGTITFNSNGTFSSSVTQTDFAIGDLLTVETQSALNGMDTPFFTLAMTLL